jgi:hypothetical protein
LFISGSNDLSIPNGHRLRPGLLDIGRIHSAVRNDRVRNGHGFRRKKRAER